MKILRKLLAKLFRQHYGNPNGMELSEPYILIRGSDSLAPAIAEQIANIKLRANGDYSAYAELNDLAMAIRVWQAKHAQSKASALK